MQTTLSLSTYRLQNEEQIPSPSLIYYTEILRENTRKAIALAGGAERLWPHVKTHKMANVIKMQMDMGIRRFKCATIPEARMLCQCGAEYILLAYPLVGPNITRFAELQREFPSVNLWAIADDLRMLTLLGKETGHVCVLIDTDMGMHRTGVPLGQLKAFAKEARAIPGVELKGIHGYDGHQHAVKIEERKQDIAPAWEQLCHILEQLKAEGIALDTLVMGGTPTFPCYAPIQNTYCSPGTCFLTDWGYLNALPELPFEPAAAVLCRVISRPGQNRFTLDLGYKAIAADPAGQRGVIVGFPEARPVLHSEEHWVFEMDAGQNLPEVGDILYVIPTHICPTTALYPFVWAESNGVAAEKWEVTARNH